MLKRFLPHPVLTVTLVLVWVLLINSLSMGTLVFGIILGVLVPFFTAPYWPGVPRIASWSAAIRFVCVVLWDIVVANIQVAKIVLFKSNAQLQSRWVVVPLDIRSPEAITVLAGTITMTPGTVSADLSADGRSLLVHCLDAPDGDAVVADIKARYEARLKEVFA